MFYEKVKESADFIRERTDKMPSLGVILGSGLGSLVDIMEEKTVIPYQEIPNFPQSSVAGHAGNLVIGRIGKEIIIAMQGRFHFYEGFTMKEVTYPIYVMKLLGVKNLIVTNACGGINRAFVPGDLMLLTDYICWLRPKKPQRRWELLIKRASMPSSPVPAMKPRRKSGPMSGWVQMLSACPPYRKLSWQIIWE